MITQLSGVAGNVPETDQTEEDGDQSDEVKDQDRFRQGTVVYLQNTLKTGPCCSDVQTYM